MLFGNGGKETVVIASPPAQAMPLPVESDTGNQGDIYMAVGNRLTNRLHNVESPLPQVATARIAAQFHPGFTRNLWQKDGLTRCHKPVEQMMRTHLIGQRIVGKDCLRIGKPPLQTIRNGKRQLIQRLSGELSL